MKVGINLPSLGIGAGVVAVVRGAVLRSLALVVIGVALVVLSAYKLWRMGQKRVDVVPSASPLVAHRSGPAAVNHIVSPPKAPPLNAAVAPVAAPPAGEPSADSTMQLLDRIRVTDANDFTRGTEAVVICAFPFYFWFAGCGSDVKLSNDLILSTSLKRCFHSISSSCDMTNRRTSTARYQSESAITALQGHQLIGAPNRGHSLPGQRLKDFGDLGNFLFEQIAASQAPVVLSPLNPRSAQYSYCVLGVKKANDKDIVLLIADPNKTSLQEAIYSLTLGPNRSTGQIIVKECSAQDAPGSVESIQSLLCFPSFDWNISFLE